MLSHHGGRPTRGSLLLATFLFAMLMSMQAPSAHASGGEPNNCDYHYIDQCFQYALLSPHFAVIYNTTGRFATTQQFARNVSMMAEAAYQKLVVQDGFTPPARNPMPIYLDLARGGFTDFLLCSICTPTPSDLQNLQIEFTYKSPCPQDCGMPASFWGVAHEFFHTIQFTQFGGRLPFGRWLAEGSANWAGYEVVGNESRWDPWVISAWMGQNGSSEQTLDDRRYDNAFFLYFLSDHYGGTGIIMRILATANRNITAGDSVVQALKGLGYNKTLGGIMNEFAATMLTGNFSDRSGAAAVLRKLPPIGGSLNWTGTNRTLSTFTKEANGFPIGSTLQVASVGGTEYLQIKPTSGMALTIDLKAQNLSCFSSRVIARGPGVSTTFIVPPSGHVLLQSPDKYEDIFVAVTRSGCSEGIFSVSLSYEPASPGIFGILPYLVLAAAALVAVISIYLVRVRRRGSRLPWSIKARGTAI